ncbi:MAG: hypothetical protein KAJ75_02685 [Alphaproteobacteria bacterium]|nr:hypothetical protein [Alphaproteobacteria bacterium]
MANAKSKINDFSKGEGLKAYIGGVASAAKDVAKFASEDFLGRYPYVACAALTVSGAALVAKGAVTTPVNPVLGAVEIVTGAGLMSAGVTGIISEARSFSIINSEKEEKHENLKNAILGKKQQGR